MNAAASPELFGFSITETGGGCTAWFKEFPSSHTYLLLTADNDASHELVDGELASLGLYSTDADHNEPLLMTTVVVGGADWETTLRRTNPFENLDTGGSMKPFKTESPYKDCPISHQERVRNLNRKAAARRQAKKEKLAAAKDSEK